MKSKPSRVLCWFSCGAASAVAAKLTAEKYPGITELLYCDTSRNEHPDNARFLADVERWIGLPVKLVSSRKYETAEEVFAGERYMSGIAGAKCTVELKKKPRFDYQGPDDLHVFGLTVDERRRVAQFVKNNHELALEWPLVDACLSKADCFKIIEAAGIELPAMYHLGYTNNNCLGCVKATSPSYWNKVRKDFPAVFERRATQSRALGVRLALVKGVRTYLDELPADSSEHVEEDLSCGPQCAAGKGAA